MLRNVARRLAAAARLAMRDPRSFLLTMRMACWMGAVSIIAPLVPLPRMIAMVETRRRWPSSAILPPEEIGRAIDRVLHAGLVKDGSCWKRAAVLRRYLLLNGIDTDVVFGVRRENGALIGHAWLERDRAPFLERDSPAHYTVTLRAPSR